MFKRDADGADVAGPLPERGRHDTTCSHPARDCLVGQSSSCRREHEIPETDTHAANHDQLGVENVDQDRHPPAEILTGRGHDSQG
jgi:hypothetical protein